MLSRMKNFKILRDYRRAASTLAETVSGIAHLHNIILTDSRKTSHTNHNASYETALRATGPRT